MLTKAGPIGWAIGAGVDPDTVNSPFIYCGFMGKGEFVPISVGIVDSLTDKIYELDGFPDPTICGETMRQGVGLYIDDFLQIQHGSCLYDLTGR